MAEKVTEALNGFLKQEGKPPIDGRFWGDVTLKYEAGKMVFAIKEDKIQLRRNK